LAENANRILVVDDEENARIALSKILEQEGYQVSSVANGLEALEFLQHEKVEVIITDLRMPEMGGLTFLRELSKHYPRSQVIMITAYGGVESYLEAIHLGAYEYIHKPVKLEELRMVMQKMLSENKPAKPN
jgi:DNA-binding NtrC family response regulator